VRMTFKLPFLRYGTWVIKFAYTNQSNPLIGVTVSGQIDTCTIQCKLVVSTYFFNQECHLFTDPKL